MHKKCVIIAGKEYINDIRPKQNIIKCLYFNYLEKFNEWMDQQSYDMLWDCYRIINMLKWWLNLFYANCIYKCLRVLRYPGIELAYPEKNTNLPQAQFTQVTGKIYHINCIKPPLLYSLWCLTPLSTIFQLYGS